MPDESKTRSRALQPNRAKLDPRFAYLLSLPASQLRSLKRTEVRQQRALAAEIHKVMKADRGAQPTERQRLEKLADIQRRRFAPLTAGVYFPDAKQRGPVPLRESFFSAFALCDGSAGDLARLGAHVRAKAGDVYTLFVPRSAIGRLEKSAAVRFIELARLNDTDLNVAMPYAQIDTLHSATPPVQGAGVIVGILDTKLDFYHPDFRKAGGTTRVRYLWDQTLTPQGAEAGPPGDLVLPGFTPPGGALYGVEYDRTTIDTELNSFNPSTTPAYQTVRHSGDPLDRDHQHGTHVAGIAVGNGPGDTAGKYIGAAPAADLIFVALLKPAPTEPMADSAALADAFAYVFARAGTTPCVVNRSGSDNQGPHDGTSLGERFLDNLLNMPGRAITLAAGNSNKASAHAAGKVPAGGADLILDYAAGAGKSDDVEIWYDGHDRFNVTVTIPTMPATIIGPVMPGMNDSVTLGNNVEVKVTSVLNDARNGDNVISIIINVPSGQTIQQGAWTFRLEGTPIINGSFHAWVDRNNRSLSAWRAPFLQDETYTVGVPSTARGPITVANHLRTPLNTVPTIDGTSGRGPTRDGRVKPEIASTGDVVKAARLRDMNAANPGVLYRDEGGTSMSAPLVAGACALLFECRGGGLSCADLKQILLNTAGTTGVGGIPNNAFGFGYLQLAGACSAPAPSVDVWLRDNASDTGAEPFTGGSAWLSPDIEILDRNGNPVPNPTHDPAQRFSNIIRVTIRNRGTQPAHNTEVFLYWADPATYLPFPQAWSSTGICVGPAPNFVQQGNTIVVPRLAAAGNVGATAQVQFAWAPPAPGNNLRGDDHFCLLVRLENQSDPSQIASGGWVVITEKNNIALHNVHVQPVTSGDSDMGFYVEGATDSDSLQVVSEIATDRVALRLPIQMLPWRDANLTNSSGRRLGYGVKGNLDPLADLEIVLRGAQVEQRTDIIGAQSLALQRGVAEIVIGKTQRLWIPSVRVAAGVRASASLRVTAPRIDGERRHVHVTQLSGGRVIGGVSLEFRSRADFKRNEN